MPKATTKEKEERMRGYVGVQLDPETKDKLIEKAKLEQRTLAQLVRVILTKAVEA